MLWPAATRTSAAVRMAVLMTSARVAQGSLPVVRRWVRTAAMISMSSSVNLMVVLGLRPRRPLMFMCVLWVLLLLLWMGWMEGNVSQK